ncbi:hypothetical protein Tco_0583726, partial [Tanacetum coccineum]
MKEAIQAKHMDFENAIRFKRQMFKRSRPLKYQGSSDKKNDFNPPTTLCDYLKGARSLVAKA